MPLAIRSYSHCVYFIYLIDSGIFIWFSLKQYWKKTVKKKFLFRPIALQ